MATDNFKDNGEVMEAVKAFVRDKNKCFIDRELRTKENQSTVNTIIQKAVKEQFGYDSTVSVIWDETGTMSMGRIMLFSPVNGALLNFSINP